jgi:hypothetical protein
MPNDQNNQLVLPLLYRRNEKKNREWLIQRDTASLPQSAPVKREDFPAQPSLHLTGVRIALLIVALACVTIGMFLSCFFLFFGTIPLSPIEACVLPITGLVGVGGGAGMVLWITLSLILKRPRVAMYAQRVSILPSLLVSADRAIYPPEPCCTGELVSSHFVTYGDRWIASEWREEPARLNTDKQEAIHIRKRLLTLRLDDAEAFPSHWEKEHRYQIKNVNGSFFFQRKNTDAFVSEERRPSAQRREIGNIRYKWRFENKR